MNNIFSYKGLNPSVCVVLFRGEEVLLIKRSKSSLTEPSKLSFPGGHHDSNQPYGSIWKCDKETSEQAALRELKEETNIYLPINYLTCIGEFPEQKYNDGICWTVTTAYFAEISKHIKFNLKAMDDAEDAQWIKIKEAKKLSLAFNNNEILLKAINSRYSNDQYKNK